MNALGSLKKLLTGATSATREITAAIEELRAKRLSVLDERDRILGLPHPRATILAAIDRDIDAAIDRARDQVYLPSLLRGEPGPHLRIPPADVLAGLLISANRTAVRAELVSLVEAQLGDQDAPTEAERAAALKRLADDLADLESAEESLIRQAEASGLAVLRRADADPDTLLLDDDELS